MGWSDFIAEKQAADPAEKTEELIKQSIASDVKSSKVAISLSSGIDSTLIATIVKKNFPDLSIDTVSTTFSESFDETPAAKTIAEKLGTNHHVLYIENFLEELPNAISIVKWPFWDLHWYYVAKKAKSLAPILLSGDGGDEMFGGYTFRYEKFLSLLKPGLSPREKTRIYLDCHERDWVPDQPDVFGQKASFSWNSVEELLEPYFDNQLDPLTQVFLADYNGKLLYNMAPIYGMFHEYFDVKYLAPLLDKNTIAFAAKIPPEMKFDKQTKTGKTILRKILEKYNMESLVIQKKQGFSIDTINYWKSSGKKLCQHFLADSRSARDGLLSSDWITKYLNSQDLDVRYVNKFLGLLAVEIWYRLFVTKEMKPSEKLVV